MSLNNGDLSGTLLPRVSIDTFDPKAGEVRDVIVVTFYLEDKDPADDLNTFIQRGFIDTLDVEVSTSTDEDGYYLVFVEMSRNETFPDKFRALLTDIENLSGDTEWEITTYLAGDRTFSIDDPELFNYVIVDPEHYVSKDEFKMKEIDEGIAKFFADSYASNLTINGNTVTISYNGREIITEVVDVGDYDTVIGRNFLSESAFGVGKNPFEANVLAGMIGNCQILPLGKYLCVSRDEQVMLLKNTQLIHRDR